MKQIFINLPVENLEKSAKFYTELGFTLYPKFTFKDQICVAWSDQILVMLQSKAFLSKFSDKVSLASDQYLLPTFTLPVDSLGQMNEIADKALQFGGKEPSPIIEESYLQVRTIQDLDGHSWGILYLDSEKFQEYRNKIG